MQTYSDLIDRCKNKEEEAVIKGIAMGAVILSRMGPIYMKGSVKIFQDLALQLSPELRNITTMADFDQFHESFIDSVQHNIKRKDERKLSYGEAQKAVNVFLKNYVDRSSLPNEVTAEKLRPFLHVPLDSVMIQHFRDNFAEGYAEYIQPKHGRINQLVKAQDPNAEMVSDRELSQLKHIVPEVYFAWQAWFRDIYPAKPVLLDTIWSLEREQD